MNNTNINFHQTFYPNFDYIGKILSIADGEVAYSIEEISDITGIPTGKSSGKVLPHIKYSEYMNLINVNNQEGKLYLKRTELGELIFREDPFFSEDLSRLLCHMFLTSPNTGAGLWCFIYRELQFKYGTEIKRDVIDHDIHQYFGKSTKLSAFNTAYSSSNSFGNLNLSDIEDDYIAFKEFDYDDECLYGILYSLYFELKNLDDNRSEFTTRELFEELKWQNSLNWSERRVLDFLSEASDKGWLHLNRQLNPIIIVLKRNIRDLIELIYSELI